MRYNLNCITEMLFHNERRNKENDFDMTSVFHMYLDKS